MKEVRGNIFDLMENDGFDAFCITTNGFVKSNGECVMGRGIALECKKRWKSLPERLGTFITMHGNHVYRLGSYSEGVIYSFPVKHNWWEEADIELIKRSCQELMRIIDKHKMSHVLLPRPGCGNGKLKWEDVKPIIEPLLDDRVYVATF